MSMNCSSTKKIVDLSQIIKLISCFFVKIYPSKKFSKMISTQKKFNQSGQIGQYFYPLSFLIEMPDHVCI